MSFTAKLLNAVKRDSGWKITVEFTDGSDVRTESYRFTGTTTKQLKAFVRSEATKLEGIKTADFSQHIGKELDLTPEPVIPPPDPTAEEIAKAAWFKDRRKYKQMVELTEDFPALATSQINTTIANLRASLETDWLPNYFGDL